MNPLELSVKDICQRNFRRDPSWRVPKGLEFSRQVRLRKSNKSPTSFGAFDAVPSPHNHAGSRLCAADEEISFVLRVTCGAARRLNPEIALGKKIEGQGPGKGRLPEEGGKRLCFRREKLEDSL
jgi:hypothetical protein